MAIDRKFYENRISGTEVKSTPTNQGSGAGYLAKKFGLGALGTLEGITDFIGISMAKITGNNAKANLIAENDLTGTLTRVVDEKYNPSGAMKVAGDISSGVGQGVTYIGAGILTGGSALGGAVVGGVSAAGGALSGAYQKTGQIGGKEYAYATLVGATEGILEGVLSPVAGRIATRLTTSVGKSTAKGIVKTVAKEGASEFLEEAIAEYANPFYEKWSGVDKNAQTSLSAPSQQFEGKTRLADILYAGALGFASGGILSGSSMVLNNARAVSVGSKIVKNNSVNGLIESATAMQEYNLTNKVQVEDKAVNALNKKLDKQNKELYDGLSRSLEQYNKQKNKTSTVAKMYLGNMAGAISYIARNNGVMESYSEVLDNAENYKDYINKKGVNYTTEDIIANKDGVAEQLAVLHFTGKLFADEGIEGITASEGNLSDSQIAIARDNATIEEAAKFKADYGIDLKTASTAEIKGALGEYSKYIPTDATKLALKDGVAKFDTGKQLITVKPNGEKYDLTAVSKSGKIKTVTMTESQLNEYLQANQKEAVETTQGIDSTEIESLATEWVAGYSELSLNKRTRINEAIRSGKQFNISDEVLKGACYIIANRNNLSIEFSDKITQNGVWKKKGNNTYAVINAKKEADTIRHTVLHETFHDLSTRKDFKELVNEAYAKSLENNKAEVEKRTAQYKEQFPDMTEQAIREEIAADYFGKELSGEETFSETFSYKYKSLWQRAKLYITNLASKLRGKDSYAHSEVGEVGKLFDGLIKGEQVQSKIDAVPIDDSNTSDKKSLGERTDNIKYSLRTKPAPNKIEIAYKLFNQREDGNLYPLYINPDNDSAYVKIEEWYDADEGEFSIDQKNGRKYVKAQGGLQKLAYRPGWHSGSVPFLNHIGVVGEDGKQYLPKNFVWAEVEVPADKNYQAEANNKGTQARDKALDYIPQDGYYKYKTNSNAAADQEWYISGALKVVRLLSDVEAEQISGKKTLRNKNITKDIKVSDRNGTVRKIDKNTQNEAKYSVSEDSNDRNKTDVKNISIGKKYNNSQEYLNDQITGHISSKEYEDMEFSYVKKDKYKRIIRKLDTGKGEIQFRQSDEKNEYSSTDKNGELIRDNKGIVKPMTEQEILENGLPVYDTTIFAFNKNNEVIGQASDEFGVDGIWVLPEYQKLGIGTELLYELRKQFKNGNRKLGQATNEGRELAKSYYEKHYKNIRYSLSDSQGKKLTEAQLSDPYTMTSTTNNLGETLSVGQVLHHSESQARDEQGRLLVVYHGTPTAGFSVFRPDSEHKGYFFTDNKRLAETYSGSIQKYNVGDEGSRIYQVYLNMKKPFIVEGGIENADYFQNWNNIVNTADNVKRLADFNKEEFLRLIQHENKEGELRKYFDIDADEDIFYFLEEDDFMSFVEDRLYNKDIDFINLDTYKQVLGKNTREWVAEAYTSGKYDGVIFTDIADHGPFAMEDEDIPVGNLYIAFDENQIKLTTNLNPTENEDIRYSLNKTSRAIIDKAIANLYTENYYGTIPNKAKTVAVNMLNEGLGKAEEGAYFITANKVADYLIDNAGVETDFSKVAKEKAELTISILKPHLHSLDLSSLKGEIRHIFDKDKSVYLLWGKRQGERGTQVDVLAEELAEEGIHLSAHTPADMLVELNAMYKDSLAVIRGTKEAKFASALGSEEKKALRNKIAKEIVLEYDKVLQPKENNTVDTETAEEKQTSTRKPKVKTAYTPKATASAKALIDSNIITNDINAHYWQWHSEAVAELIDNEMTKLDGRTVAEKINGISDKIMQEGKFSTKLDENTKELLSKNKAEYKAIAEYYKQVDLTDIRKALIKEYGEVDGGNFILFWGNENGEGMEISEIVEELKAKGIELSGKTDKDLFSDLVDKYSKAKLTVNNIVNKKSESLSDSDYLAIKQEVVNTLLNAIDEKVAVDKTKNIVGQKTPVQIAKERATLKGQIDDGWTSFKNYFVNSLAGCERAIGRGNTKENAETITQSVRVAQAVGQAMLGNSQYNVFGEITLKNMKDSKMGKGLQAIWEPINKKGDAYKTKFQDYLLNYHNIERATLKKAVLDATPAESLAIVEKYNKSNPEFKKMAEEIWAFNRNALRLDLESGLISEKTYNKFVERYPHYIPTYRDMSETQAVGLPIISGKYATALRLTEKRAGGGNNTVLPLEYAMALQTMQRIRQGAINKLNNAMYNSAINSGDFTDINLVETESENATLDENANIKHAEISPSTSRVEFFINGEKRVMVVSKQVFAGLNALNNSMSDLDPTTNLLKKANSAFKTMITSANPAFMIRNAVRDIQEAMYYTKYPKKFAKNYTKAMSEIKNNGELWQLYVAMGGFNSTIFDAKTGRMSEVDSRGYHKVSSDEKLRSLKKGLQVVENTNIAIEQLPRFMEFISSLEAGNTAQRAILESADITCNFGRSGIITKWFNSTLIPFLNPAVQGFDKIMRTVYGAKSLKGFAGLALKAALLGILPQMLSSLMYKGDDEYEALSLSTKENYWLFKFGDKFIKLPKGRINAFISSTFLRAEEKAKGGDYDVKGLVDTFIGQLTPVENLSRSFFSPFQDVKNNTTWYGSAIENQYMDNLEPKYRYDEGTSSIAIGIGKVLNVSPKKVHYLLDSYSGVVGDFVLPMTTQKSEKDFISANFTVDPVTLNRWSNDFYDLHEEITYTKTTAQRKGDLEAEQTATIQLRYLNKVKSAVNEVYDGITEIQASNLSNKEKLDQTRVLRATINSMYVTALTDIDRINEAIIDTNGMENTDLRYTEVTRIVYGAERALREYNANVYTKAETLAKANIDYDTYYNAYFTIKDIESDKDKTGKTIAGSKKKKILSYINTLKLDNNQKTMLMLSYGYTTTNNNKVIQYINRLNIPREEKEKLMELCGIK